MSNGRRFWGKHAIGNNRVTTREWGDIPGCTPAVDVFVDITLEDMRLAIAPHTEKFIKRIHWWSNGRDDNGVEYGHREFMNDPIHNEKRLSAIRNPAKSLGRIIS
jgi:hypothetical protein